MPSSVWARLGFSLAKKSPTIGDGQTPLISDQKPAAELLPANTGLANLVPPYFTDGILWTQGFV